MLAVRQKLDTIAKLVMESLQSGVIPKIPELLSTIIKEHANLVWGRPTTKLRAARRGYPIGGRDGYDIDRTVQEMRNDLSTFMAEILATADTALGQYDIFKARKENLDARLSKLNQLSDHQLVQQSNSGTNLYSDTFTDLSHVDLGKTNAEFDLDGGFASLPMSLYATTQVSMQGTVLETESAVGATNRSSFLNTIDEVDNTGWFAQLNNNPYSCTLNLPGRLMNLSINAIEIVPTCKCGITVEYSNDGLNFYRIYSGQTSSKITANFGATGIKKLRFNITSEGTAGIRSIKLLKTAYEDVVKLQSTQYVGDSPISAVTLITDQDVPHGTSIKHYIAPVYMTLDDLQDEVLTTGSFQLSEPNLTTWLDQPLDLNIGLTLFSMDPYSSEYSPLYSAVIPAHSASSSGISIIDNSAQLIIGTNPDDPASPNGQMLVEYYNLFRAEGHIPTAEDWISVPNPAKGYTIPPKPDSSVIDPLRESPSTFGSTLIAQARSISESISNGELTTSIGEFSKLQIPVFEYCATVGDFNIPNMLVQPGGNYRFTSYIYMPEALTYNDQACYVLNESGNGTPACVQFSVYLNSIRTAGSPAMISGEVISPEQLAKCSATFSFKRGWNKFEIYMYVEPMLYTNPVDGNTYSIVGKQQSSGMVTDRWLALYISPNPYEVARTVPGVKVRAFNAAVARATEFQLRQLVSPTEKSWAWSESTTPSILINFPTSTPEVFDELSTLDGPSVSLNYRAVISGTTKVMGCVYRAELSKDSTAIEIPKLFGYSIITDPED